LFPLATFLRAKTRAHTIILIKSSPKYNNNLIETGVFNHSLAQELAASSSFPCDHEENCVKKRTSPNTLSSRKNHTVITNLTFWSMVWQGQCPSHSCITTVYCSRKVFFLMCRSEIPHLQAYLREKKNIKKKNL
jgi:hypothetical protein